MDGKRFSLLFAPAVAGPRSPEQRFLLIEDVVAGGRMWQEKRSGVSVSGR
jgi:hypothetical protein